MPPQPPTTFRIEDLKARLKLEPKSRLFYPLAEELRKIQRFADAEKVLRDGLTVHAGYISAWISLGRVLYELGKYREAVEILQKACTLDPGNVVAARLLADSHYALGEKVEAIKKYKLVRALLPVDEEINHTIARLEVELTSIPTEAAAPPATLAPEPAAKPAPEPAAKAAAEPAAKTAAEPPDDSEDRDLSPPEPPFGTDARDFPLEDLGPSTDAAPVMEAAALSPERFSAAPLSAPKDDFDQTHPLPEGPFREESSPTDPLSTPTMADLYARQGHADNAREIYSKILQAAPDNEGVKEKLDSLAGGAEKSPSPPGSVKDEGGTKRQKVDRLEKWLSHVARK